MYEIAETIFRQLGGNKFVAMTGARAVVKTERGLLINIPGRKINSVVINLDANDTYSVSFNKRTNYGIDIKQVASVHGVYADQLCAVFTEHTGLYTSL